MIKKTDKRIIKNLMMLVLALSIYACGGENTGKVADKPEAPESRAEDLNYSVITEDLVAHWDDTDNIDSPAYWENGENKWVIATAKSTDKLFVYNADDLSVIKTIGGPGKGELEFARPNGIWIADDLCFVVERDNHRVQLLRLPEFQFVKFIGADKLRLPYGISITSREYELDIYVTDAYETPDETIPADSLLGKRVLNYKLNKSSMEDEFIRYIGATEGEGVIKVPESIYADPENDRLLIAEELEEITSVKVYSLSSGEYSGKILGKGLFKYQAEGIAMYDKGNAEGYWLLTDQDEGNNTFHVFDRKSLEYKGSFKSKTTQNTDGVWLTQAEDPKFPMGRFIPVHNDGGVSVIDMKKIFASVGIETAQ